MTASGQVLKIADLVDDDVTSATAYPLR